MATSYVELLSRLALNDRALIEDALQTAVAVSDLDPKSLAVARLAALIAVGGSAPSFAAETDAALNAGLTAAGVVDVLLGVTPVVGAPRVVLVAPRLAMGLGVNLDDSID